MLMVLSEKDRKEGTSQNVCIVSNKNKRKKIKGDEVEDWDARGLKEQQIVQETFHSLTPSRKFPFHFNIKIRSLK